MTCALNRGLLEAFGEPALLANLDGDIILANTKALIHFEAVDLASLGEAFSNQNEFKAMLTRAAAVSGVVPAALETPRGPLRVTCIRVSTEDGPLVCLKVRALETNRFLALNAQIETLHGEIRERRRIQEMLEEALRHNRLLLSELQHRVKNTIQMMIALLNKRAVSNPERSATSVIEEATRRLMAISRAYEVMHFSAASDLVRISTLIESLAAYLSESLSAEVALSVHAAADWDVPRDHATAIALIVNELATNAQRRGLNYEGGEVRIALESAGEEWLLSVGDNGAGFPENMERESFGLTLVRGLCRQIGARLEIRKDQGAVCTIAMRKLTPASEALC